MRKILLSAAVASVAVLALAASKKDPVLMTVNGHDVPRSEFEYLYHKNNQQQLQPQSIDEYLDMFVNYKLKVADALAAGLDTTTSFRNEYRQFCSDLAQPYLTDSATIDDFVNRQYANMQQIADVSHIMMMPGDTQAQSDSILNVLSQVRQDILDGKMTWEQAVVKYSVDQGTTKRGGHMGWIRSGQFPWAFEDASFSTPVGGISQPLNSGIYNHIVRVEGRQPSPGEVKARHILKLTMNKTPEEQAQAKQQIDSLYNVLVAAGPQAFADVAKTNSQDGSAGRGGDLGWFGKGAMVAEFDSVAFALQNGEISKPFQTRFGWHIVLREDSRGVKPLDEVRPQILGWIDGDERGASARTKRLDELKAKFKSSVLKDGLNEVRNVIAAVGAYDSVAIAKLSASDIPVYTVAGVSYPVSSVMPGVIQTSVKDIDNAMMLIGNAVQSNISAKTVEAERMDMIDSNPAYSNLVREYRDGILLFDISNRKVWDRAAKDSEGLQKYFEAHRDNYRWTAPKYKGYIVFSTNDSVLTLAKEYCDSIDSAKAFNPTTIAADLRARFGRDIKIEKVLAAKGDNPISDYLVFNGPVPAKDRKIRMPYYFAWQGAIIDQPQEAADVRGAVTTDYQNELEKEWLQQLHDKYPVKINRKVLKTVK